MGCSYELVVSLHSSGIATFYEKQDEAAEKLECEMEDDEDGELDDIGLEFDVEVKERKPVEEDDNDVELEDVELDDVLEEEGDSTTIEFVPRPATLHDMDLEDVTSALKRSRQEKDEGDTHVVNPAGEIAAGHADRTGLLKRLESPPGERHSSLQAALMQGPPADDEADRLDLLMEGQPAVWQPEVDNFLNDEHDPAL